MYNSWSFARYGRYTYRYTKFEPAGRKSCPMLGSSEHQLWLERQLARPAPSTTPTSAAINSPRFMTLQSAEPSPSPSPPYHWTAVDTAVGSEGHSAWLDRSVPATPISGRGPTDTAADSEAHSVWLQKSAPAPAISFRTPADTAAGSRGHSSWLDTQLSRRTQQQEEHLPAAEHRRRQEPSTALPAGVQVLLRGQDASAITHAEWLGRQLTRGKADDRGGMGLRGAGGATITTHAQWLDNQLAYGRGGGEPSSPYGYPAAASTPHQRPSVFSSTGPPVMPYEAPSRSSDPSAGSPKHDQWLNDQIERQKARTPSSLAVPIS